MPCTKMASSLGILPKGHVFITAFVWSKFNTQTGKCQSLWSDLTKISRFFGHHNTENFKNFLVAFFEQLCKRNCFAALDVVVI